MSVHTAVREFVRRRVARWEHQRTERYISSLPLEIQKDIGWRHGQVPYEAAPAHPRDVPLERRW